MKQIWKYTTALIIVAFTIVGLIAPSGYSVWAADADRESESFSNKQAIPSIEEQIRSFAKSINQKNADDTAAKALAKHGLSGGGKKLSVGKSHALTATLWNSELLQVVLIESCAPTIETMQNLKLKELNYVHGYVVWGVWEGSWGKTNYEVRQYSSNQYTMPNIEYEIVSGLMHSSKANAYDKSLEWMVSHAFITLTFRLVQVTDNEMTYQVTCEVEDRFDFDTSQGSGFGNLISGLAALFFREFDWESKVDFQLKVPNACSHSGDFTSKVTKPTCAVKGYTTHTCSLCGYSYKDTYTAKTDHKFSAWQQTTAPTCIENGVEARNCLECGLTENRAINELGHHHVPVVIEPTCTQKGFTTYSCVCGDSYVTDFVTEKGHLVGEWMETKASTCTEKGIEIRKCANCNYSETRMLAILEHSMSDWNETRVPTCTEKGSETRNCANCDYSESREVETNGHDYNEIVTHPTCTDQGYTTHICKVCGEIYKDSYVNATGHIEKVLAVVQPTCTESGLTEGKQCSVCGEILVKQETVSALGHNYTSSVTPPTCTEKGYIEYTCHCGDSYRDSYVEMIEHSWNEGIITSEPTYEAEGERTYTCEACGSKKTETIEKRTKLNEIQLSDNNVKVEVPKDSNAILDSNTILSVEKMENEPSKEMLEKLEKTIGKKSEILAMYDISLILNHASIQPGGKVAVTLPMPKKGAEYENIQVVFVDDNGNKVSEVRNDDWLKTYGLFQEVYKKEEDKDANSEAKALLSELGMPFKK